MTERTYTQVEYDAALVRQMEVDKSYWAEKMQSARVSAMGAQREAAAKLAKNMLERAVEGFTCVTSMEVSEAIINAPLASDLDQKWLEEHDANLRKKPVYCLGWETIRKVADLTTLETEYVNFVAADDLLHNPPYTDLTAQALRDIRAERDRSVTALTQQLAVARLDEAKWWEHLAGNHCQQAKDAAEECNYCKRIAKLEAEAQAREGEVRTNAAGGKWLEERNNALAELIAIEIEHWVGVESDCPFPRIGKALTHQLAVARLEAYRTAAVEMCPECRRKIPVVKNEHGFWYHNDEPCEAGELLDLAIESQATAREGEVKK